MMKIQNINFLVKLCCNLMILAKKPNVDRNFGSKMPNYSCGDCWRFWGLDHSTLKAYIFYTVGRKYFWLVALERTKKDLSEAHKFCPLFFINGPTVISQSTVKIIFSRVHATLQPALSVGRSVGWSVGPSHFTFFLWFYFFDLTAPAQMVWWPQIWPLPTRTRLR